MASMEKVCEILLCNQKDDMFLCDDSQYKKTAATLPQFSFNRTF